MTAGLLSSTFTFWRFMIHIPLGLQEMRVAYDVNGGEEMYFVVPGRTQNMRWAAYSVRRPSRLNFTPHVMLTHCTRSLTASSPV